MKNISIFGSTGSIGTQTLSIVDAFKENFHIKTLTTNKNIELLEKQCEIYNPESVVIANETAYNQFKRTTNFKGNILCGENAIIDIATDTANDLLIMALVGFAGVLSTYRAIQAGINIALANKEVLVAAGSIIMDEVQKHNVKIIPVDSEHSAIFQCLIGENKTALDKIILTASGGPFYKLNNNELENITLEDTLKHPTWNMGTKVTIDSATMMNKGFEVIEAAWLFDTKLNDIEVIIHPQAIIHSMVKFKDGSMKAQLSPPDMRYPIAFAMNYPERLAFNINNNDNWYAQTPFNVKNNKEINLTFIPVTKQQFKCLELAYIAQEKGGNMPTILNAANEVAVQQFIKGIIKFTQISQLIELALEKIEIIKQPSIYEIIETDIATREFINAII